MGTDYRGWCNIAGIVILLGVIILGGCYQHECHVERMAELGYVQAQSIGNGTYRWIPKTNDSSDVAHTLDAVVKNVSQALTDLQLQINNLKETKRDKS